MAKRKRRYVYEEDEDFDVGKYTRQNMAAARANVSTYRKERPQRRLSHQATYGKSENRQSSHNASECTISLDTIEEHDSHVEGDEYVEQIQTGWQGTENTSFSTSTRASEVQWYDQLGEKCEEWEELCKRTFTDMIRCCICGVCELGSVRTSTFDLMEADPQYMIDDDVPSRVRNPGLPGDYVVETHGDKQMWKVCKECKKNPAA